MDIAVDAGSGSNSLAVVQQSFCLSMIVRNEAERLVQALDSALPFIQIVLPGNYYKVYYDSGTGGTIDYWVEWS